MEIILQTEKGVELPAFGTEGAAGADIRAYLPNEPDGITLDTLQRKLIPTGIKAKIPAGHELQVRPRSGLALKHGITVLNAPGTIDSDYRGDIGVVLVNLSDEPYVISHGDRIAQLVFSKVPEAEYTKGDVANDTLRGEGGYGHTGKD